MQETNADLKFYLFDSDHAVWTWLTANGSARLNQIIGLIQYFDAHASNEQLLKYVAQTLLISEYPGSYRAYSSNYTVWQWLHQSNNYRLDQLLALIGNFTKTHPNEERNRVRLARILQISEIDDTIASSTTNFISLTHPAHSQTSVSSNNNTPISLTNDRSLAISDRNRNAIVPTETNQTTHSTDMVNYSYNDSYPIPPLPLFPFPLINQLMSTVTTLAHHANVIQIEVMDIMAPHMGDLHEMMGDMANDLGEISSSFQQQPHSKPKKPTITIEEVFDDDDDEEEEV